MILQWCVPNPEEQDCVAHPPTETLEENEYVFIWYKKMVNGITTHYTQPFRVKIKAKSRKEAVAKVERIALQKMTLVIMDEQDFHTSDVQKNFKTITAYMNNMKNM